MPEYLVPGVYVCEVAAGAKPIEGVSTSTAPFVSNVIKQLRILLQPVGPEWSERNDDDRESALLEVLAFIVESLASRNERVPERGVVHGSRLAAAALAPIAGSECARESVLCHVRFHEKLHADSLMLRGNVDATTRA